jgi:UTP-glucose-1-phosphate uridylyltransferase
MSQTLQSVIQSINALSFDEKHQLWQILDEEMRSEEENWIEDDKTKLEIQQVRQEYTRGEYVTFDQYLAQKQS